MRTFSCGTTLVELMIYIALYGILLSGILVSMYSLIESSGDAYIRAVITEEGLFLSAKTHRLAVNNSAHDICDLLPSYVSSHITLSHMNATDTAHSVLISFQLSATSSHGHQVSESFYVDASK